MRRALACVAPSEASDVDAADALDAALRVRCGATRATHARGTLRLFARGRDGDEGTDARGRPLNRGRAACVLGVPSSVTLSDFVRFAAGAMDRARRVRAVRRDEEGGVSRRTYDVLLEFDDRDGADVFVENYHGRRLTSMGTETCVALYVESVEWDDSEGAAALERTRQEVPTCPVCLDRLDADASGIATTVCNHSFHAECLSGWADASCPVCRHVSREAEAKPTCATCGKDHDLWVCLICGEVRCGRYAGACAVNHWKETNHTYSLELGTQRVWDYVSDGFVHRLIQSKSGLVDLTPPDRRASTSGSARGFNDGSMCSPVRAPDVGDMDAELEEALVASKLDAIASEYDLLLTSQLESQRKYFENLLQAANARAEGTITREDEESRNAATLARAMDEAKDAKRELNLAQKANSRHVKTIETLRSEIEHLQTMCDSLSENVQAYKTQLERAEKRKGVELALKDARIKELEDENRDLMLFLDTSSKLQTDSSLAEDIAGGTIVGIDTDTTPSKSSSSPARNATHERLRGKIEDRKRSS